MVVVVLGAIAACNIEITLSIFCNATVRVSHVAIPVAGRLGPVYFTSAEPVLSLYGSLQPHGSDDPHPGQWALNGMVLWSIHDVICSDTRLDICMP